MRLSIAFLLVLWFGLIHLARAQEVKKSQPIAPFDRGVAADLVDLVRRSGWQAVMSVVAKLESADKERYPGVIAFAADIRTFENAEDRTKAPRDWSPVDGDALLLRNPNFWRAMYEVAPGDSAMTLAHIGMWAAMGEIDLAHNLIHLSN